MVRQGIDFEMINMYDFISSNASYFDQLKFSEGGELFIDYLCPITEPQARVWSHKNCLMYVVQGAKGYASMDYHHKSQEHQVLFIRKGGYVLHQHFEKPYRALIFMFDEKAVKTLLAEYPGLLSKKVYTKADFMSQPVVIELGSSSFIESIFISSLEYLKHPATESVISLKLKFQELLVNLLREKDPNAFHMYLSWLCNDESVSFIKLMRENSHFNFTTKELARTAGMSVSTFKRTFKKHFDIPPGQWLREQRIAKAMALLSNTGNTISEIAFELGYSDAAAFSKAFKRANGLNPTDYRRELSG